MIHGSRFNFWYAAESFLTNREHIYNANFQSARLDIDLSIKAACLSDLNWIAEARENSRYTGADCNISSLPGRLASINRPIHQAGALPLTCVSEADEGNKWWREGINQRRGGGGTCPLTGRVKPRDGAWWRGKAQVQKKEGVALCLEMLG